MTKTAQQLVGKQLLLVFSTTHLDRAGETRQVVTVLAEVVALVASRTVVAITDAGMHFEVPAERVFVADSSGYKIAGRKRLVYPAYVALHEVFRDFHQVTGRPVRTRWLRRKEIGELLDCKGSK